jgi:hypothetical protein
MGASLLLAMLVEGCGRQMKPCGGNFEILTLKPAA